MLTTYKTTLSEKKELAKDVFLFRFQLAEPKELHFRAGQYLILLVPAPGTDPVKGASRRLYSIASPSFQKGSFELLVQIIPGGLASTYLLNLKVGQEIIFQGPAGMFALRESPRPKIFLATGTGIAPIRSMIISNLQSPIPNFYLFWGLPHFSDIYFLDELKSYQLPIASFEFKICLSREKNLEMIAKEDRRYFALGHVDQVLEKMFHVSRFMLHDFYLCGSRQVVESLRQYLYQKGAPKKQVFFEKF